MTYRDLYPRTITRTYHAPTIVEHRTATTSSRKTSELKGVAVPFDTWTNIGPYMERIWRSCFMASLDQDPDIPLLLFHNRESFPVGIARKWVHAPDGLHGTWELDSSDLAREAGRLASLGYLRFSIGFQIEPDGSDFQFDDDGSMWVTRLAARLLEVSLTPTPAYAGAKVTEHLAAGPARAPGAA